MKSKSKILKDMSTAELASSKKSWTEDVGKNSSNPPGIKSGNAYLAAPINKKPQLVQPQLPAKEETSKPVKKGKPLPKNPPKDILESSPKEIVDRTRAEAYKVVRDTTKIVKALLHLANKKGK